MNVRTRFAPSPTGYLHLGGARTALFSWLFARQQKGDFILRIEDTDTERSTQESVDIILEAMDWLGLNYDEGPFYQTQRIPHYQAAVKKLVDDGHAYRCYCSKERLAELRDKQIANKEKPRYDGHCRPENLKENKPADPNAPFVIRLMNPTEGVVEFNDLIHGPIVVANSELDDLILQRADGMPTYNLTVVVDDWEMKVTHVIRGDDHINNTPRQINILKALGAPLPHYAHVPMILAADGQRLSKRHGAVNILHYRDAGYLPEAMLNYLARLGWSFGDQEIFTVEELVQKFDLKKVNKAAAAFDPEKLLWVNQQHIKNSSPEKLAGLLKPYLEKELDNYSVDLKGGPALEEVVKVQKDRYKTLLDMAKGSLFWYQDQVDYLPEAAEQWLTRDSLPVLEAVETMLSSLSDWLPEAIHLQLNTIKDTLNIKFPQLAQPLRVAVAGNTSSPSIDATLYLLGKERALKRIHGAQEWIKGRP